MSALTVRTADPSDAPTLSAFAARTFAAAFGADNTAADMTRYVAEAFTPERQAAEIADADGVVLLADVSDPTGVGHLAGYAHLVAGPGPAAVTGPPLMELKRLYVDPRWHGRGVAPALMDAALHAATARSARTLWLGVWERNARVAAFYAKYGFRRVGEHTFVLGGDPQTDWLMARTVADS